MHTVRLELLPGDYKNEDVYHNVLSYIFEKYQYGGYGFYPYRLDSIIEQFALCEDHFHNADIQKIWHFIITFDKKINTHELFTLADTVALQFAPYYQVLFGVDIVMTPHLHFAINAYPMLPNHKLLDYSTMQDFMHRTIQLLHNTYPAYRTTLQLHKTGG